MENTNNRKTSPMEDDDDLELLRLAALKSLKKEVPTKPINAIEESHVIPVVSNVRPVVDKFYTPGEPEMVQPNLIHHPVPPYINSGFEKMEINETYVPQRLNPPVAPYSEFVPFGGAAAVAGVMDPTANVQLSPRSAAFVFHCQNKQTVKRRQGLSPSPGRMSPGRWSRSPSPESWKYRRSKSRSPTYTNHSPHFRNRSVSRSPHRRRHSPQPANVRRNKTRSPTARNNERNNERNNFETNAHRVERRSPGPNRRANSPNNRHPARPWRENGVHARKSGSPRNDDATNRRRRTRSPNNVNSNAKSDVRRRTTSRSPNRKYPRNNLNRPPRRGSPSKRFNANNRPGGARNRNYNRRSPNSHRRSHSPQNHHKRRSPTRNTAENGEMSKNHGKESTSDGNEKLTQETKENETNESATNEKTEKEFEDEMLASSDSENSDNDDGIDLFASEESESENEGRFKLSSSKSERKANVPVVSFSELGKATTAPADVLLRDLDELQTDTKGTEKRGGGRRENDRNRSNRRDDRRYNRDRDRENRDRNRDRGRTDRRERESESSKAKSSASVKNAKHEESRKAKEDVDDDVKGDRKPNLFKPTFTSVDSEHRTKTPDAADKLGDQKKVGSEKRSAVVQVKRSSKSREKSTEKKSLQSTVVGSTTNEKRASPPADSSNGSAKKPIHLRLGAMTKTFKPNKKTWRTEKQFGIIVLPSDIVTEHNIKPADSSVSSSKSNQHHQVAANARFLGPDLVNPK